MKTLVDYAYHWAKVTPDKDIFVFRYPNGSRYVLSFSKFVLLAKGFAAKLQNLGIRKGDIITNFLVMSPERVVTDMGIILAGAIPMHGDSVLADGADLIANFHKAKPKGIVIDPDYNSAIWKICQTVCSFKGNYLNSPLFSSLKNVVFAQRSAQGEILLFQDLEANASTFAPVALDPDDFAYILTTSGTTAFSKLVVHTHRSLIFCSEIGDKIGFAKEGDRKYAEYSTGFISDSLNWCLVFGTTRISPDQRVERSEDNASFIWKTAEAEKCTNAFWPPIVIDNIYRRPELWRNRTHTMDALLTGAQPILRQNLLILGEEEWFACQVNVTYGSTEVGLISSIIYTKLDQVEDFATGENLCIPIKIVDKDFEVLPEGQTGQLLVKTPHPFWGYLGDPEATQKAFTADGWFKTGDYGHINNKGRLYVLGRFSDAIMRGPVVVYPQWLESRIRQCPGVADVVLVPVHDDTLFQEICACVMKKDGHELTETHLDLYCENLFTAGLESSDSTKPKYFLFFDKFPLNKREKKDRRQLAQIAQKRIASQ